MNHIPGDTLMMHDPKGKKHRVTITEAHECIKGGKFVRTLTAKQKNGVVHTFRETYSGFSNWTKGWGLTYDAPQPKPVRVGCIIEMENKNDHDGALAKYTMEVLGMFRPHEKEENPYYQGRFACKVLTAKETQGNWGWQKPYKVGSVVQVSVNRIGKVIKPGTGMELIPFHLYMTVKEQNAVHKKMGIR